MKLGGLTANVPINGRAMRQVRQLTGYSVKGLAEQVGCSRPYITMLETGARRACSPALYARICKALRLADRTVLLRQTDEAEAA